MPKWRIIIPVFIVLVVGVAAYMQMKSEPKESIPPPVEQAVDAVEQPLDVTGEEDIEVQVDAVVDMLLNELADEEVAAGDGREEINAETAGQTDSDILDVEYYEE